MAQDDDWEHVHIKLDPDMKENWEDYVEDDDDTSTLSGLIRSSVQKEITGEFEATEEKYDEIYTELSNLMDTIGTMDERLQLLRQENIEPDQFEDGLDTVIGRMEELHGATGGEDQ